MTILPIIPPNRAATIEIAIPVALEKIELKSYVLFCLDSKNLPKISREDLGDKTVQSCVSAGNNSAEYSRNDEILSFVYNQIH